MSDCPPAPAGVAVRVVANARPQVVSHLQKNGFFEKLLVYSAFEQ